MSGAGDPATAATPPAAPVRLAPFAALAVLAALQWASLLAEPPLAGLIAVALVAVLVAAALSRLQAADRDAGRRLGHRLAAPALIGAGLLGGLVLLGLPVRVLPPWNWDELGAGIDVGLRGLGGSFDYPFSAPGEWSRLLLIVAVVPLLIGAAALSFRPGRDPDRPPLAGLLVLVAALAIPATARPTGLPLLWGAALLVAAAVWLWGERARVLPAAALIAGCGVVAVPAATSLAGEEPPIDYRGWAFPGAEQGATFDWSQSYGPIDWPRTGQLLFRVRSERPNYWRAAVLDEFYADRWRRSGGGGEPVAGEPVGDAPGVARDQVWTQRASFDVVGLESPLVISPGSALQVRGLDGTERDPDGTMHTGAEPITPGSSYSLNAYAPDPRPGRLRAASRRYGIPLAAYTALALPDGADLESLVAPTHFAVPLWGHRRSGVAAARLLAATPYDRVAELAARLTAGSGNAYDAAVAVESHLRTGYRYDERPPERRLPLRAFLFRDRIGYCQQFSGAMALMLRTVGIPARVAAGFAPGTPLANGRGFEVTDLDAHSWVEVYFNRIGWVPFDPTPPTAPATPEIRGGALAGLGAGAFGRLGRIERGRGDRRARARAGAARAGAAAGGGVGAPLPPLGLLAVAAGLALVPPLRGFRHRRLSPADAERRELAELRAVLRSTGWSRRESTTLLVAEGRLRAGHLGAAANYVRRFRECRYGADDVATPSPAERRSARRELAASGGLRRRLRMLVLMPPGGPRRVRRDDRFVASVDRRT